MRHGFEALNEKPDLGDYLRLQFPPSYKGFTIYVPKPHPKTKPHDRLVQSILERILEQYPIQDSYIDGDKIKVRIHGMNGGNVATDVPQIREIRKALLTAGYAC